MHDGEFGFMQNLSLKPQRSTEDDMTMNDSGVAISDAIPIEESETIQDIEQFDANDSPIDSGDDWIILEEIELIAPWAVRYGDKVYVQMKISVDAIQEVKFEMLGDFDGRFVVDWLKVSKERECFKQGLFELSAKGVGLRVSLLSADGAVYVMPPLEYSADRDFSTVESSDG